MRALFPARIHNYICVLNDMETDMKPSGRHCQFPQIHPNKHKIGHITVRNSPITPGTFQITTSQGTNICSFLHPVSEHIFWRNGWKLPQFQ